MDGNEAPPIETPEDQAKGPEKTQSPESPTFGFHDGYFVLKISQAAGFLGIMGFLSKATIWVSFAMDAAEKQKQETKLVKPGGFGRFNLFK